MLINKLAYYMSTNHISVSVLFLFVDLGWVRDDQFCSFAVFAVISKWSDVAEKVCVGYSVTIDDGVQRCIL